MKRYQCLFTPIVLQDFFCLFVFCFCIFHFISHIWSWSHSTNVFFISVFAIGLVYSLSKEVCTSSLIKIKKLVNIFVDQFLSHDIPVSFVRKLRTCADSFLCTLSTPSRMLRKQDNSAPYKCTNTQNKLNCI